MKYDSEVERPRKVEVVGGGERGGGEANVMTGTVVVFFASKDGTS